MYYCRWPPNINQILSGGGVLRNNGDANSLISVDLNGRKKGILFSANWVRKNIPYSNSITILHFYSIF